MTIEEDRAKRDKLRERYDAASDVYTKRDTGMEINRLNDKIKNAMASGELAKSAQLLEAENSTLRGEVQKIRNEVDADYIQEVKSRYESKEYDDVMNKYHDLSEKIKTVSGKERSDMQTEIDVLSMILYEEDIKSKEEDIRRMLPDEFSSVEELAKVAEEKAQEERDKWYNLDDSIKNSYIDEMMYGKRGVVVDHCNLCKSNILSAGKTMLLSPQDQKEIAMLSSPEEIVSAMKKKCVSNMRNAYEEAVHDIDESMVSRARVMEEVDGEEVEVSVGVTCDITDEMIEDIKDAFERKEMIEAGIYGKGRKYIIDHLRDNFGDRFDDDDYRRMSSYENVDELVTDINETCLRNGIYDTEIVRYGIDNMESSAFIDREETYNELDDVFGDYFTKPEYEAIAKNVTDREDIINANVDNLTSQFAGKVSSSSKISAARRMNAAKNIDYNERWDKVREKLVKSGTSNISDKVKKMQVEEAKDMFNSFVESIDRDSLLDAYDVRKELVEKGLQDIVVRKVMIGVKDIEDVRDDNEVGVHKSLLRTIKGHDLLSDDVISGTTLKRAFDKKNLLEYGDPRGARSYMMEAISSVTDKIDMSEYEKSLSDMCCEEIESKPGTVSKIVDNYVSKKKAFIENAGKMIREARISALESMYAGEYAEEYVDVPKIVEDEKKKKETKKREKKEKVITPIPVHQREEAVIYHLGKYRAKVKDTLAKKEAEFLKKGYVLKKMPKSRIYNVYGENGEYLTFDNAGDLDKWLENKT